MLGTFRLGSDEDELAFVREHRGVDLNHIVRQVVIDEVGLKRTDHHGQVRFHTARILRRNGARHQDSTDRSWTDRIKIVGLICHGGLIVNFGFKSRGSQSLVGLVEILGVVENPHNDRFCYR